MLTSTHGRVYPFWVKGGVDPSLAGGKNVRREKANSYPLPSIKLGISTALQVKRIFPARLDVENMKMAATEAFRPNHRVGRL